VINLRCPYWFFSGLFFVLFEGLFWNAGNHAFKHILYVFGVSNVVSVYSFDRWVVMYLCLFMSVLFFGLMIFFTGKELVFQLK